MANKIIFFLRNSLVLILLWSCSKDPHVPTDETKDTGHDEWAKVEFIIREGHLHGANFHGKHPFQIPILPEVQKVVFERTPDGIKRTIDKGETLRKDVDAIEVFASPFNRRYSMEIIYYNEKGERMNYEFMTKEMLPIHQHFFTIDKYIDLYDDTKITNAPKNQLITDVYDYVYRDTDPEDKVYKEEGVKLLKDNPVGLKGYFHFKKALIEFDMKVQLNHFNESKFDANGKADPANNPSRRTRILSATDFSQIIPFVVIATNGSDDDQYIKEVAKYYNITEEQAEEYIYESNAGPDNGGFWL